jgi:hypothetical protein
LWGWHLHYYRVLRELGKQVVEFQRILIMEGSRRKKSPVVLSSSISSIIIANMIAGGSGLGAGSASGVKTVHDGWMAEIVGAVLDVAGVNSENVNLNVKGLAGASGRWRKVGFEVCFFV